MNTIATPLRHAAIAAALLLALPGTTAAQSGAPTPAQQNELEAARAELKRAAERLSALTRKYRSDDAKAWAGLARRPVLGVLLGPDPGAGVRIAGVTPDSAAADAGLRSGDRLLSIDGSQILGSDAQLRVENARKLIGRLDAKTPVALGYERDGRKATVQVTPRPGRHALLFAGEGFSAEDFAFDLDIDHDAIRASVNEAMRAVSKEWPRIDREIVRLVDCGKNGKGGPCRLPMLTEAFRWSGLNLAAVDPQLGRYFGASQGVLVLSTGDELAGLQPGDVVQKIDGQPVRTPREAMAALRARPAGSRVRVDYLRDRKPASAQVKVPEAVPFRIPSPPPPPEPPAPPRAPGVPRAAPPPPPAPPPPSETAGVPAPPAAPAPPDAPRSAGQRRLVFVDDDGRTTVLEGDDAPPLPPPTPTR